MSDQTILTDTLQRESHQPPISSPSLESLSTNPDLPLLITQSASKQTYYTIRFLVDRDRVLDAYRAYGYFRWVDDTLDKNLWAKPERIAFLERQQHIIDECYRGEPPYDPCPEESILVDLIKNNPEPQTGLEHYVRNMMAVMAFDAKRRGSLISQQELSQYSNCLATAVTEALHYFIGHNHPAPHSASRYSAVTAAHITHMLRDTYEDIAAGYFNIPCEFLNSHKLDPCDIQNPAYRVWVKSRVQLAKTNFDAGKNYLAQVTNLRCRMAGYAYMARFEEVLNKIERDDYQLRPDYPERKSLGAGVRMGQFVFSSMLKSFIRGLS